MSQLLLTEPSCLSALLRLTDSSSAVDDLVRRFRTWDDLAEATPYTLAGSIGAWAGALRIPAQCPPMPAPGAGVRVLTRYHAESYPTGLSRLSIPPALIYVRGNLPARPMVAIGGSHHPSADAVARARAAARTAVSQHKVVVAAIDTGCGRAAVEEALAARGTVLAIAAGPIGVPSANSGLFDAVIGNGGSVLSAFGPGSCWSELGVLASAEQAAALGDVSIVAEFGVNLVGGLSFVQSAVRTGRPLVSFSSTATGVPLWASSLLTRGSRLVDTFGQLDLPSELASVTKLASRAMKGEALADVVVHDLSTLEMAVEAYAA